MATIKIPPVLRASTGVEREVAADGENVGAVLEALGATFMELKVRRDPDCPICSRPAEEITDEEMRVFPDYEAFCDTVW